MSRLPDSGLLPNDVLFSMNHTVYTVWTGNVVPEEIVCRAPGDHPQVVSEWSPDFWAKSLVIPVIYIRNSMWLELPVI